MSSNRDQMVLDAIAGRRSNGKNKLRANCPFCVIVVGKVDNKQCLELDTASSWWKCYRCDSRGHLEDLPFDTASMPKAGADEKKEPVTLPDGFVPMWKSDGLDSYALRHARKYIEHRGIDLDIVRQARIGATIRGLFAYRVVVPIYKGGKLAGYVGRSWKKQVQPKYRYNFGFERATTLYNEDALYVTTDEPVIIVEGVFDVFPFWPHACAVLGKPSEAQFEMMLNARRPIAIALDGDAHREGESLAMQLRMYQKRAVSLKLPPTRDPDEGDFPNQIRTKAKAAFAA